MGVLYQYKCIGCSIELLFVVSDPTPLTHWGGQVYCAYMYLLITHEQKNKCVCAYIKELYAAPFHCSSTQAYLKIRSIH